MSCRRFETKESQEDAALASCVLLPMVSACVFGHGTRRRRRRGQPQCRHPPHRAHPIVVPVEGTYGPPSHPACSLWECQNTSCHVAVPSRGNTARSLASGRLELAEATKHAEGMRLTEPQTILRPPERGQPGDVAPFCLEGSQSTVEAGAEGAQGAQGAEGAEGAQGARSLRAWQRGNHSFPEGAPIPEGSTILSMIYAQSEEFSHRRSHRDCIGNQPQRPGGAHDCPGFGKGPASLGVTSEGPPVGALLGRVRGFKAQGDESQGEWVLAGGDGDDQRAVTSACVSTLQPQGQGRSSSRVLRARMVHDLTAIQESESELPEANGGGGLPPHALPQGGRDSLGRPPEPLWEDHYLCSILPLSNFGSGTPQVNDLTSVSNGAHTTPFLATSQGRDLPGGAHQAQETGATSDRLVTASSQSSKGCKGGAEPGGRIGGDDMGGGGWDWGRVLLAQHSARRVSKMRKGQERTGKVTPGEVTLEPLHTGSSPGLEPWMEVGVALNGVGKSRCTSPQCGLEDDAIEELLADVVALGLTVLADERKGIQL